MGYLYLNPTLNNPDKNSYITKLFVYEALVVQW